MANILSSTYKKEIRAQHAAEEKAKEAYQAAGYTLPSHRVHTSKSGRKSAAGDYAMSRPDNPPTR